MNRKNRWLVSEKHMDGSMDRKRMKINRWMVGWMDRKNIYERICGWLDW